jgi:hypothetical protein
VTRTSTGHDTNEMEADTSNGGVSRAERSDHVASPIGLLHDRRFVREKNVSVCDLWQWIQTQLLCTVVRDCCALLRGCFAAANSGCQLLFAA